MCRLTTKHLDFIEAEFGPILHHQLINKWPSSASSTIWKIETKPKNYALKVFVNQRKFTSEKYIYENYLLKENLSCINLPKLISVYFWEQPALLLSWEDGEIAEDKFPDMALHNMLEVYEYAGVSLKEMHEIPPLNGNNKAVIDNTREKFSAYLFTYKSLLQTDIFNWGLKVLDSTDWEGMKTGFCHMDYSPRNWIIPNNSHELTVIDFEHSGINFLSRDLLKLWDAHCTHKTEKLSAFYAGYGDAFKEQHMKDFETLILPHGLGIVNWSIKNADDTYLRHGLDVLRKASLGKVWW